jgi:RNA-binding protein
MPLTGKQKSALRSRGQTLDTALRVGKAGVSESLLRELDRFLTARELVKVRLPDGTSDERHAAIVRMAMSCGAELVGEVGRAALLYRANENPDSSKRVPLER